METWTNYWIFKINKPGGVVYTIYSSQNIFIIIYGAAVEISLL